MKQPGANGSLAEKETRKRTASCAAPKLTVANCRLTPFLMRDRGVCALIRRGECCGRRRVRWIHGLMPPRLHIMKEEADCRGS